MSNPIKAELTALLDTFEIESPERFSLWGLSYLAKGSTRIEPGMLLTDGGVERLQGALYWKLHCRRSPDSEPRSDESASAYVGRLSRANSGRGTWDRDWVIRGWEGDLTIAERYGVRFWVQPDRIRSEADAAVGSRAEVWVPKENQRWLPGFHWMAGDAEQPPSKPGTVRVYWHVTPDGGVALTRALTRDLNENGIPFHFKVLNDPGLFGRADSAVLYLSRDVYADAAGFVASVYRELRAEMRRAVPLFVKRLAPGLGVAEDQGDGKSFGLYCCGLIAAVLASAEAAALSAEDCWRMVVRRIEGEGLDPDRIYLRPGSRDQYAPLATD